VRPFASVRASRASSPATRGTALPRQCRCRVSRRGCLPAASSRSRRRAVPRTGAPPTLSPRAGAPPGRRSPDRVATGPTMPPRSGGMVPAWTHGPVAGGPLNRRNARSPDQVANRQVPARFHADARARGDAPSIFAKVGASPISRSRISTGTTSSLSIFQKREECRSGEPSRQGSDTDAVFRT